MPISCHFRDCKALLCMCSSWSNAVSSTFNFCLQRFMWVWVDYSCSWHSKLIVHIPGIWIIVTVKLKLMPFFNKKTMLSQGNRAMPQLLVSVSSLPTFTTNLKVAKLRKQGFRALDIPTQKRVDSSLAMIHLSTKFYQNPFITFEIFCTHAHVDTESDEYT